MVARIAPEPVNTNVAVADYYVRRGNDSRPQTPLQESPLPPVPEPVPTPVPAPAIQPAAQAFAAQLVSETLPPSSTDSASALRKLTGRWSPPPSSLSLTDRLA